MITTRLGALWWVGIAACLAPPIAAAQKADEKALNDLRQAYYKAQQTYYAPQMAAKTDEERMKAKLDPKLNPGPKFMAKFEDFAKKAKGTKAGLEAEYLFLQCAASSSDKGARKRSFDRLMGSYLNVDMSGMGFYAVQMASSPTHAAREYENALRTIYSKSKLEANRAGSLYEVAQIYGSPYSQNRDEKKAIGLYEEVVAKFPKTKAASAARGALFEMRNLVVGKVAPDFTAVDQDGKTWKLSDYRGQVVVLDFWGFW